MGINVEVSNKVERYRLKSERFLLVLSEHAQSGLVLSAYRGSKLKKP